MIARVIRGLAAATLLVAVTTVAAEAQQAAASRFAVYGGVSLPMGDFGDAAETGFQIGGAYTMGLNDKVSLRFNADYSRFAIADNPLIDGNWSKIAVFANAVTPLGDGGLYGLGGLGFVNTGLSIDGGGSDSESDLAWNVGAGFGKGKWFVEARYQSIMADEAINSLPVVFGWRF